MKAKAVLTLRDVPSMTAKQKMKIVRWLDRQAIDLLKLGKDYSKTLIARYYERN